MPRHRAVRWNHAAATYTINVNLYKKLPYDPKDLTPVSILAGAPYILTVPPSLPVKSLKELIALAKARPKDLNYGSGGTVRALATLQYGRF